MLLTFRMLMLPLFSEYKSVIRVLTSTIKMEEMYLRNVGKTFHIRTLQNRNTLEYIQSTLIVSYLFLM
jgi:hypothetical protein